MRQQAAGLEDLELVQFTGDPGRDGVVRQALQHLADHDVHESQPLTRPVGLEPSDIGRVGSIERIDPHGRVDDHHRIIHVPRRSLKPMVRHRRARNRSDRGGLVGEVEAPGTGGFE